MMMHQTYHTKAQTLPTDQAFTEPWFEQVFLALDRLHDAVSGERTMVLPTAPEHMVGWLEDIIYTAQEAIHEIRSNEPGKDMTVVGEQGMSYRLESEGSNGTGY